MGVEFGGTGVGDGIGVPEGGIMGGSGPIGGASRPVGGKAGGTDGGKPPGWGTIGETVAGGSSTMGVCGGTAGAGPGTAFVAAFTGSGAASGPNGSLPANGARFVPANGSATILVPNWLVKIATKFESTIVMNPRGTPLKPLKPKGVLNPKPEPMPLAMGPATTVFCPDAGAGLKPNIRSEPDAELRVELSEGPATTTAA